jgi:hypothetical protein
MFERGVLLDGRTSEGDPENPRSGLILPAEVAELVDIEYQNWKRLQRALRGELTAMPNQPFRSLFPNNQKAPILNATEVAAAADTIMWDPAGLAPQTAIAANTLYSDAVLKVTAWGINTTAVTGGQTATFTPRYGNAIGGTSLGASRVQPVVAEVNTNVPWLIEFWFHVRLVGPTGTATCGGEITCRTLIGTAATTNAAPVNFGTQASTPTTINTTTAAGLLVSVNASLATNKWTTMGVVMESLN